MARFYIIIMFLISLVSLPAYAQDFEVREIGANYEYAVLADRGTGEEWVVQTGDEINDWRVVKITADYITVLKPNGDLPALMSNIPVNNTVSPAQESP
jgi:hypothetical protein